MSKYIFMTLYNNIIMIIIIIVYKILIVFYIAEFYVIFYTVINYSNKKFITSYTTQFCSQL